MKLFVLISICISLITGCVHSEFGWRPIMPYGGPYIEEYSHIAKYQYSKTINHTDTQKRWSAAVSCGATYGDSSLNSVLKDKNEPYNSNSFKVFRACMKKYGYIYLGDGNVCGLKYPKKFDKGLCNE